MMTSVVTIGAVMLVWLLVGAAVLWWTDASYVWTKPPVRVVPVWVVLWPVLVVVTLAAWYGGRKS